MDTPQSVSFGALLKRYRRAAGLTQEELAERAGLSRRGIADLEGGARQTPRRTPSRCWPRRSA
jgi:transcriptional regulator with XRE-family HTH domain